jgi:hypothetical protein
MSTLVTQTISNGTVITSSTNVIRGSAKAWVNYNQLTGTIRDSYNVSSVTSLATGRFQINFTNALPNANYTWAGSAGYGQAGQTNWLSIPAVAVSTAITTAALQVQQNYANNTANINAEYNGVIVFSS